MKQILTKKTVILVLSFLTVFLTVCCQLLNSESPTKFLNENLDAVSLEASVNFSGDLTENFKSILVWNSAHRIETAAFGTGADIFYRQGCPESRCRLYVERDALPFHQYDAVLFHLHEIHLTTLPEEYSRQPHQRFVFVTQESPQTMHFNRARFHHYFNWTMTYRRDADIPLLYGRVKSHQQDSKSEVRGKHNKTNATGAMVVWMATHCHTNSRREAYVEELRKHIDVDVYGGCGPLKCQRNGTHWLSDPGCYDQLSERYLFYLSFENSLCTDYVTEKFFMILSKTDMVPVVYGAADYLTMAPPGSFIDARLFSPSRLARYLRRVAADDRLYDSFFDWRRLYVVEAGVDQMARHGFCALCQKLHRDAGIAQVYDNLEFQWDSAGQCLSTNTWNFTDYNIL